MTVAISSSLTVGNSSSLFDPGSWLLGGAENARPENDGPRKLQGLKMQDPKMTDKSYCKIQHLKMTDHIV